MYFTQWQKQAKVSHIVTINIFIASLGVKCWSFPESIAKHPLKRIYGILIQSSPTFKT